MFLADGFKGCSAFSASHCMLKSVSFRHQKVKALPGPNSLVAQSPKQPTQIRCLVCILLGTLMFCAVKTDALWQTNYTEEMLTE